MSGIGNILGAIGGAVLGAAAIAAAPFTGGLSVGLYYAALAGGALVGAYTGYQMASMLSFEMPELPNLSAISPTYNSDKIVNTISEGIPIPRAYGFCKVGGNVVRMNEPDETDLRMIVVHCSGEVSDVLTYYVNDIAWSDLEGAHTKTFYSGTTNQTADDRFSGVSSAYRNLAYTAFTFEKTNQIGYRPTITVVGNWQKCFPVGGDTTKIWTNNPADILWDWYQNVEGYTSSELNVTQFASLKTYCDPQLTGSLDIITPALSDAGVTATSRWDSIAIKPWFPFNRTGLLTGSHWNYNSWQSLDGSTVEQRINIDLGQPYIISKLKIDNFHSSGLSTDRGINNFIFQGSNDSSSFSSVTYASTNWTDIQSGLTVAQHTASDVADTQTINITNSDEYRYYALKIADNHGSSSTMGVRRIELYGYSGKRYSFDYVFDTAISINDAKKILWDSFKGGCVRDQGLIKPVWESGKYISHVFTLDNIVKGSFSWSQPVKPNIIRINYRDSANNFQNTSIELKDESSIDEQGEIIHEENCWYITNPTVARRRLQFLYDKFLTTDYKCKLTGFSDSQHLEPFDRVVVNHILPGWSGYDAELVLNDAGVGDFVLQENDDKIVLFDEIEGRDFIIIAKSEDEYGRPTFEMEAYYAGLYDGEDAAPQTNYFTSLPNPYDSLGSVTDVLLVTDEFHITSDGRVVPNLNVTYTLPDDNLGFSHTEIYSSTNGLTYHYYGNDSSKGNGFLLSGDIVKVESGDSAFVKVVTVNNIGIKEDSDYSATGSTTVEYPNIQTLLTNLPSTGGKINLPKGLYTITSGLTVPDKQVIIDGISRTGVTLQTTASEACITFHNLKNDFALKNLTIDASLKAVYNPEINIYGDIDTNIGKKSFSNIYVVLADDNAHNSTGGIAITANNCGPREFNKSESDGLIYIDHFDVTGGLTGVSISNSNQLKISTSSFSDQTYRGLDVSGVTKISFSGLKVTNFWVDGINVSTCQEDSHIFNCILKSKNDDYENNLYGIRTTDIKDLSLRYNTIILNSSKVSSELCAIYYDVESLGNSQNITGNYITINVSSTSNIYGIYTNLFDDDSIDKNIIFVDCDVTNAATYHYGVYANQNQFVNMNDNSIDLINDNTEDIGVYLNTCNNFRAKHNTIAAVGKRYWDVSGTSNDWLIIPGQVTVSKNDIDGDFTDVSSAVDLLSDSISKIYIKEGTYEIDPILFPDKNVLINGASKLNTILSLNNSTTNETYFTFESFSKKMEFKGFQVLSNYTYSNSSTDPIVYITKFTNVSQSASIDISNLNFNLVDSGVSAISATTYGGQSAIYVSDSYSDKIDIYNNEFNNGTIPISGTSVKIFTVNNNIINNPKTYGIFVNNLSYNNNSETNIFIKENQINNFCNYGIYTRSYNSFILENNMSVTNTLTSLPINLLGINFSFTKNSNVSENIINMLPNNAIVTQSSFIAFYLNYCNDLNFANNIVNVSAESKHASSGFKGSQITYLSNSKITGNSFVIKNSSVGHLNYGLDLNTSVGKCRISSNHFTMNSQVSDYAIMATPDVSDCQGVNNIAYDVGTALFDAGSGNTIEIVSI